MEAFKKYNKKVKSRFGWQIIPIVILDQLLDEQGDAQSRGSSRIASNRSNHLDHFGCPPCSQRTAAIPKRFAKRPARTASLSAKSGGLLLNDLWQKTLFLFSKTGRSPVGQLCPKRSTAPMGQKSVFAWQLLSGFFSFLRLDALRAARTACTYKRST